MKKSFINSGPDLKRTCCSFGLGATGMGCVISKLCYKRTLLKRNDIQGHFPRTPLQNSMVKN